MSTVAEHREDADYWGLTRRERVAFVARLIKYHQGRMDHYGAEAERFGRMAQRIGLATIALWAVVAVLLVTSGWWHW